MKVDEQLICEYIFDLVDSDQRITVKNAIDRDPETRQEYVRLKNKFERLKILEKDYPNPLVTLSHFLVKKSAIAAILMLGASLWFLPNQAYADGSASVSEVSSKSTAHHKVCCTSGISPKKSPDFVRNFDGILSNNLYLSSSIESEMHYSTQYFKKLSL